MNWLRLPKGLPAVCSAADVGRATDAACYAAMARLTHRRRLVLCSTRTVRCFPSYTTTQYYGNYDKNRWKLAADACQFRHGTEKPVLWVGFDVMWIPAEIRIVGKTTIAVSWADTSSWGKSPFGSLMRKKELGRMSRFPGCNRSVWRLELGKSELPACFRVSKCIRAVRCRMDWKSGYDLQNNASGKDTVIHVSRQLFQAPGAHV